MKLCRHCLIAAAWLVVVPLSAGAEMANGACGPAGGTTLPSPPSTGLCTSGTATSITGTGPWAWSCEGSDGGKTADCSALLASERAVRAYDFWNMLGAVDGACSTRSDVLIDMLQYTGLARVRVASSCKNDQPSPEAYIAAVCQGAGVNVLLLPVIQTYYSNPDPQAVADKTLASLQKINALAPGCVDQLEGVNEPDIDRKLGSTLTERQAAGDAISRALWETIKPLYPAMPIATWANGGSWDYTRKRYNRGNLTVYADYCNIHDYYSSSYNSGNTFLGGDNPGTLAHFLSCQREVAVDKPVISTEFGSYISPSTGKFWVSEGVQAKIVLNKTMDHALLNMRGSYVYRLRTGSLSNDFGVFDISGTPRLAAQALRALTQIIKDDGPNAQTFETRALDYAVSGMPPQGHSYVAQKSDGSFVLVIWNQADIWNHAAKTEIVAPTSTVTVSLGNTYSGSIYDLLAGESPVHSFRNESSLRISIQDHPVVVSLYPVN